MQEARIPLHRIGENARTSANQIEDGETSLALPYTALCKFGRAMPEPFGILLRQSMEAQVNETPLQVNPYRARQINVIDTAGAVVTLQ